MSASLALDHVLRYKRPVISDAAETTAFLARATGLDATHSNAYKALINGGVSDGWFQKLDALYVFATDTSAHALLSLVSATYNASAVSLPTFTADQGYTGDGSGAKIDSAFDPSTASTPKFVLNSASFFLWSNTAASDAHAAGGTATDAVAIYPRQTSTAFFQINNTLYGTSVASSDGSGLFAADRDASNSEKGYRNGSSVVSTATASSALASGNLLFLSGSSPTWLGQAMAGGFGSSLTATDHANLYARLHTYLQTIAGIP